MRVHQFHSEQLLPFPLNEVFGFFANPENLEILTPPWLHFHIVTPGPIKMGQGRLIDYQLRIHHVPIRWQSEITSLGTALSFCGRAAWWSLSSLASRAQVRIAR